MKQKIIRENGYYWSVADGAQYLWETDEKKQHGGVPADAAKCRRRSEPSSSGFFVRSSAEFAANCARR